MYKLVSENCVGGVRQYEELQSLDLLTLQQHAPPVGLRWAPSLCVHAQSVLRVLLHCY